MPTQLNVTVSGNSGGTSGGNVVVTTVTVLIPTGLQNLDSNNSGGQGQVSQLNTSTGLWSTGQTGFSSVDTLIRAIFKNGSFLASNGTWYGVNSIQSITWT